jgi:hypothetical protein
MWFKYMLEALRLAEFATSSGRGWKLGFRKSSYIRPYIVEKRDSINKNANSFEVGVSA